MTVDAGPRPTPDLLPPHALPDRRLFGAAAVAFAISFWLWSVETPGLMDLIAPIGREHAPLHVLWRTVSDLARGPSLLVCIGLAFLLLGDAARRQLVVTSALLSGIGCSVLKLIAHRPRPMSGEGEWSWPSGHTASAITFALVLTASTKRPRRWQVLVWSVCASIAVSRVLLLRHWPSDVIGGCGVALATIPIARRLPLVLSDGGASPRTLTLCGLVALIAVLFVAAVDPRGLPIPRAWAILLCSSAALAGMRRESRAAASVA